MCVLKNVIGNMYDKYCDNDSLLIQFISLLM